MDTGTQECQSYTFKYKDRTVHLIDTPGFDDTKKSDTDVLKDIAGWLLIAYRSNIRLSGMVYLHSISETRMKGSHMTNLRMFQKLAGLENMGHVILTTTMWDKTPNDDGKRREMELLSTDDFWGSMIKAGSEFRRFHNDKTSALSIVGGLVDKHDKLILSLQREMADGKKDLDQTSAGKALNVEMNAQKEQYERRLKEQESEMKEALRENDMKYAQELADAQDKISSDMARLEKNQEELKVSNEKLLLEKEEQIRKTNEEMAKIKLEAERQGKMHQDEIGKIKLANQEAEQEMARAKEKLEADSKAFRDSLVTSAADMVTFMDQHYTNLTAEQEERVKEMQASLRAQQLQQSPPPPYAPFQAPNQPSPQQSPQPCYPPQQAYQPMPQQMPQQGGGTDSLMAGAAAGIAAGTVAIGGLPLLCTIM